MPLVLGASSGYLFALVQTLVALAGVSALAVLVLRWAAKRGLGRAPAGRRLELVERLPLEHGGSVCLVRVDGRELLVGTAPGRPPVLVSEVESPVASRTYRDVDTALRSATATSDSVPNRPEAT